MRTMQKGFIMNTLNNDQNTFSPEKLSFESKAIHGAQGYDPLTGAVSFPIYQTATFRHRALGESTGFDYSRVQNPTRQELERTMAILEEGLEGFAFSSGQAANMALFSMLSPGDHVLLSDDIYGGTFRMASDIFSGYGILFESVDMSDLTAVKKALRAETALIFVETPTNPMMKVADIAGIAAIAHSCSALLAVDNTFLTPYFQTPLKLGADIVVHSGTKFLAGHNDTICGIVVVNREDLAEHFRLQLKTHGSGLASFDSWLVLRGLKTLQLRMERHNENSLKIAAWLRRHPKVTKVYYVGFEDHPGYEISLRQSRGFGGMISFTVDSFDTVKKLLSSVHMILFAESLGGPETLITYPPTQTHESIPEAQRFAVGITDTFLRLSVGLENPDDIIGDLEQSLG